MGATKNCNDSKTKEHQPRGKIEDPMRASVLGKRLEREKTQEKIAPSKIKNGEPQSFMTRAGKGEEWHIITNC